MGRTLSSKKQRELLHESFDGKCAQCGKVLADTWHADHIVPWKLGGRTNLFEMQPLCPKCNLGKGANSDE